MSDVAIAAPIDKPKRLEVRGKLRHALDAMIWEGLTSDEAATQFDFRVRSLRDALSRPHVLAYIRTEREVLRASVMPKNIHRLREIRDAADNMPAVNAIKLLEELGDDHSQRQSGISASPGVTIRVVTVVQQPVSVEGPIYGQSKAIDVDIAAQSAPSDDIATHRKSDSHPATDLARPSDATPALPQSAASRGRG